MGKGVDVFFVSLGDFLFKTLIFYLTGPLTTPATGIGVLRVTSELIFILMHVIAEMFFDDLIVNLVRFHALIMGGGSSPSASLRSRCW
jgi:hypothetical protein